MMITKIVRLLLRPNLRTIISFRHSTVEYAQITKRTVIWFWTHARSHVAFVLDVFFFFFTKIYFWWNGIWKYFSWVFDLNFVEFYFVKVLWHSIIIVHMWESYSIFNLAQTIWSKYWLMCGRRLDVCQIEYVYFVHFRRLHLSRAKIVFGGKRLNFWSSGWLIGKVA